MKKYMKAKQLWIVGSIVLVLGAGVGYQAYHLGRRHGSSSSQPDTKNGVQTDKKPSIDTTPDKTQSPSANDQKPSINKSNPAGLFNASYRHTPTDFAPWKDSPVTAEYHDFNDDGITDAFVWAKLPGTAGSSYAAVWTLDATNQPKELWHLPDDQGLDHSTWSVTSNNGLENKSLKNDGSTDSINTYHWQVTGTGQGFVLEPAI